MAYTLATLIQLCRRLTGDTSVSPVFADEQLQDFINLAIADLSQHFPRRLTCTLSTTAGRHEYDLEPVILSILSCEYPAGGDPPTFIKRCSYSDPAFYLSGNHYDFIPTSDAGSLNPPRLVISASPAEDEEITLETMSEHNALTSSGDTSTILDRHAHLVALFVRWKCLQELSTSEAMDPDPLQMRLMTEEINARRAETAYRDALRAAKEAYGESTRAPWSMDKWDGGYS